MTRKGSTKPEAAKSLTREQVKELLLAPKGAGEMRDYYLLAATYYLGRRIGETVLLQPRHFENLEFGEVTVPILKRLRLHRCKPRCASPCPSKGKHVWPKGLPKDELTGLPMKKIPVIDGKILLSRMLAWCGARAWIFRGRSAGSHLRTRQAQSIFRMWATVVGLPDAVTAHSLRHTAVTFAVDSGGIALGRDLAAHANIATTDGYVKTTEGAKARARGSLSAPRTDAQESD